MGEDGYEAYKKALEKFIISRKVFVPRLSKEEQRKVDSRREIEVENHLLRDVSELNLGQKQELKLMDFQVKTVSPDWFDANFQIRQSSTASIGSLKTGGHTNHAFWLMTWV